jgi:hypothetical protein
MPSLSTATGSAGRAAQPPITIVWRPQSAPQLALVRCPAGEVFMGGARGGGKTDAVLGKWALKEAAWGPDFNAVMFRRTTVSSEDAIERSRQIYTPLGGKFNESKLLWRMPNGGRVAFAYLDTISDADEYQGRNLTDVWVEEAGQYPDPGPIDRLFGTLRSAKGVPIQMILTGNPGGAGQHWISERYRLIPFPQKPRSVEVTRASGIKSIAAVIPARITDNVVLLDKDAGYVDRLRMVGSAALVRAWLEGDWSAIEGAFFDCWDSKKHIVAPFAVPKDWLRFRAFDWGSAAPFSVGWWAVCGDELKGIPRGALVRYREWYGATGDKGLKLTVEEVAKGILERDAGDKVTYSVADPAIFAEDGGPSRAEIFSRLGVHFSRADNRRVAGAGAMGGWDEMRQRLKGKEGVPMLYVFETCPAFIRTVPVLPHDPKRAEDVDTSANDHVADEARYACMSRPWVPERPVPEKKGDGTGYSEREREDYSIKAL